MVREGILSSEKNGTLKFITYTIYIIPHNVEAKGQAKSAVFEKLLSF